MGLQSIVFNFKGDPRLEAFLINDPAHLRQGDFGSHVAKIQLALMQLDSLEIDDKELKAKRYGPSTAAAVLKYKQKRHIINFIYQKVEDDIVGKMTIKAMDDELLRRFPLQFAKVSADDFYVPRAWDPVKLPEETPKTTNFQIRCRSGYSIWVKVHLEFDIFDPKNTFTAEYVYTGFAGSIGVPVSVTHPGPFKPFTTSAATSANAFEGPAVFSSLGGFNNSAAELVLAAPPMTINVSTGYTEGFDVVSGGFGFLKLQTSHKGSPASAPVTGSPAEA